MKKDNILIWCIVIFAFLVRILFLDKPAGLWHNEMVMYNQTMAGNVVDIINASVNADVHFPLYQIFLAGWIKLFGNSDIMLRMFSVLGGVLGVVAAYFAGKEFKDKNTGCVFALLCAFNATFVFYSQEVKFYIFLPLFVTLSLYFIARFIKSNRISDFVGYILSNMFIIYTFTIGILYVIAQGLVFFAYIIMQKRELLKRFLIMNGILIVTILPFIIFMITHMGKYEGASWIFTSNIYTTLILIQNYFTPCLVAVYNNPPFYLPSVTIATILLWFVPVLIIFTAMFTAIKNDKRRLFILAVPLIFLLFEIILCLNSGLRMLTRYTIMAIPPFLLLAAIGLSEWKTKIFKIAMVYLLLINSLYLIVSPQSAVRGHRDLGEKPVAKVMFDNSITDNDVIVLALRKNDFDKYLDFSGKRFSLLQDFVHEPYALNPNIKDKYDAYWDYVKNYANINSEFEKDFVNRVIKPLNKHARVFYIWDENYNTYPVTDYEKYRKIPVMTSSLSKMNNEAFYICDKYLTVKGGMKLKYYRVFIFEK